MAVLERKRKVLVNPIAVVPFNKATKSFCEDMAGAEAEEGQEETNISHTCPYCQKELKFCSCYNGYDYEDYWECICGYSTREKLSFDMTPGEVLDRIEAGEIQFENCEEVEA